MMAAPADKRRINPNRYRETVGDCLVTVASTAAICPYPETTNRRNLLCTTCPRTYETLELETDMSLGGVHAYRRPTV